VCLRTSVPQADVFGKTKRYSGASSVTTETVPTP
jgi:hypothetical protein